MKRVALCVLALTLLPQASASQSTEPAPRLADVIRAYEREVTPYNPFTASETGLRQYDRVLANTIGEEYRKGLADICSRHLGELRRIDAATLGEPARLTRDIF